MFTSENVKLKIQIITYKVEKIMKKRTSEKLEPTVIGFGDEFTVRGMRGARSVVTSVRDDKEFEAMHVIKISGKEALVVPGGTGERRNVGKITDHWSLERVEQAIMVYLGGSKPEGRYYDLVRDLAKAEPKELSL